MSVMAGSSVSSGSVVEEMEDVVLYESTPTIGRLPMHYVPSSSSASSRNNSITSDQKASVDMNFLLLFYVLTFQTKVIFVRLHTGIEVSHNLAFFFKILMKTILEKLICKIYCILLTL